jgi:murein L,D-transpeptidase YafK
MISRRTLLAGGAAFAGLSACEATPTLTRSEQPHPATSIVVYKAERRLHLLHGQVRLKSFDLSLGFNPVGPKRERGDGRTPEGTYYISSKNPGSAYHLSVGISYPSTIDVARARARGVSAGEDIFIHGQPRGIRGEARIQGDWTAGCIAVTNSAMQEIYASVREGIPVFINP